MSKFSFRGKLRLIFWKMKKFFLCAVALGGLWVFSGTESGKIVLDGRLFQARIFFEDFVGSQTDAERAELLGGQHEDLQQVYESLVENLKNLPEKLQALDLSPEEFERQLVEKKIELETQKTKMEEKLVDLEQRYKQAKSAAEQLQDAIRKIREGAEQSRDSFQEFQDAVK